MRHVTPEGTFRVSPSEDPDLFWATIGAMGLTGIVTSVELNLMAVETDHMVVDTDRFDDLRERDDRDASA